MMDSKIDRSVSFAVSAADEKAFGGNSDRSSQSSSCGGDVGQKISSSHQLATVSSLNMSYRGSIAEGSSVSSMDMNTPRSNVSSFRREQLGGFTASKKARMRRNSISDMAKIANKKATKAAKNPFVKVPIQLIGIGAFILGSIFFYRFYEGWKTLDCIYFVIVTICTVGYGTPFPSDDRSRAFTIFLMFFGIFVIFSTISNLIGASVEKVNGYFRKSVVDKLMEADAIFRLRLFLSVLVIAIGLFIGTVYFHYTEGWSVIESLYFAVETSTTVGYGDMNIHSDSAKIFLCFYIIFSTILLANAINNFNALVNGRKLLKQREKMLQLEQTLSFICDLNQGMGVNKHEFVLAILTHIGTLNHDKDVLPWIKKFEALDRDNTGILDKKQLEVFSSQQCEESKQNIERMKAQTPRSTMKTLIRKKSMQNLKDLFAVDAVFNGNSESSGGEGEDGDEGIQLGESRSSSKKSRKSNTGKDFHRDYFQDNFAGHAHALSRRKKNEWSFFFSKSFIRREHIDMDSDEGSSSDEEENGGGDTERHHEGIPNDGHHNHSPPHRHGHSHHDGSPSSADHGPVSPRHHDKTHHHHQRIHVSSPRAGDNTNHAKGHDHHHRHNDRQESEGHKQTKKQPSDKSKQGPLKSAMKKPHSHNGRDIEQGIDGGYEDEKEGERIALNSIDVEIGEEEDEADEIGGNEDDEGEGSDEDANEEYDNFNAFGLEQIYSSESGGMLDSSSGGVGIGAVGSLSLSLSASLDREEDRGRGLGWGARGRVPPIITSSHHGHPQTRRKEEEILHSISQDPVLNGTAANPSIGPGGISNSYRYHRRSYKVPGTGSPVTSPRHQPSHHSPSHHHRPLATPHSMVGGPSHGDRTSSQYESQSVSSTVSAYETSFSDISVAAVAPSSDSNEINHSSRVAPMLRQNLIEDIHISPSISGSGSEPVSRNTSAMDDSSWEL